MYTQNYESLAAYILTVDKAVLVFLLPIDFLLAVAIVALLSRHRRPWEILSMLVTIWFVLFLMTVFLFDFMLHRPFLKFEIIQYPVVSDWFHLLWKT